MKGNPAWGGKGAANAGIAATPGKSGNPNGRKSNEECISPVMRYYLGTGMFDPKTPATIRKIITAWYTKAQTNANYMGMLLDRMDGKVPQPIVGDEGGPMEIKITVKFEDKCPQP